MHHQNFYFLAGERVYFRVYGADILSIYVPIYALQRFKSGQFFGQGQVTKIPRMPDLIAFFKIAEDLFIKEAMCI